MAAFWAVAGINAAFSSLGGESTITASEEKKFSTVDKLKSYGYGILGGISKFSTGCRQSMDWVGEHLLDYDRPNGEGGKSYRQIAQENDARDEASYNKLREKAPCKTAFEDSSNASETTLDLASLAMGVYGVKQLVSSGANYLRMNKSYINANISEAAQNSKILKQAINNVSKNSKGITLGSNGGNAGKYVSDVKGEFDALKNIKNGTKVAGNAKAGGSGSIDDMVNACEGVTEAKSQRWLDAEAKLKKSATGDIGSTIDKNTGYEVGTIFVDPRGNAMISPKGGGINPNGTGYRGMDMETLYPNGSVYQRNNPNGHASMPGQNHGHGHLLGTGPGKRGAGSSIDINGNVVPFYSPDAHWQTK